MDERVQGHGAGRPCGAAGVGVCVLLRCYKNKGSKAGSTAEEQADEAHTQTPTHAAHITLRKPATLPANDTDPQTAKHT